MKNLQPPALMSFMDDYDGPFPSGLLPAAPITALPRAIGPGAERATAMNAQDWQSLTRAYTCDAT